MAHGRNGIDGAGVEIAARGRGLELGRLLAELRSTRGWARLGYSSLGAYARERPGLSLASVEHRLTLARAAQRHPSLERALEVGSIGYEAGLVVAQVLGRSASEALARAWVKRAERRMIRFLREEVRAVTRAAELSPEVSRRPPDDEDMEAVRALEEKVLSGEPMRPFMGSAGPGKQTSVTLAVPTDLGRPRGALTFRISRDLLRYGLRVEAEFRSWAPPSASFMGFLCTNFWRTWLPVCVPHFWVPVGEDQAVWPLRSSWPPR